MGCKAANFILYRFKSANYLLGIYECIVFPVSGCIMQRATRGWPPSCSLMEGELDGRVQVSHTCQGGTHLPDPDGLSRGTNSPHARAACTQGHRREDGESPGQMLSPCGARSPDQVSGEPLRQTAPSPSLPLRSPRLVTPWLVESLPSPAQDLLPVFPQVGQAHLMALL